MGDKTGIQWTDATVNFWWGCTKVSPACDHCYAEAWDKRTGGAHWGLNAPRKKIKSAVSLIRKLDREHAEWSRSLSDFGIVDRRRRVFIQSMSDLFDLEASVEWFDEAWHEILRADRLSIQIVTKRISVVEKRLAEIGHITWPRHVGLMITVCNQQEADRDIPRLLALKAKLNIPWVGISVEPMLGPIDLTSAEGWLWHYGDGVREPVNGWPDHPRRRGDGIDWVICGGESGHGARPMHPDWTRSLRDQCAAAGVPFFFKQWGEWGEPTDGLHKLDWPYHPDYDRTHWFDARTCARPIEDGWSDKYHGGGALNPGVNLWKTPEYLGQVARCPQTSCREAGKCMGNEKRAAATRVGKARAGRLLDGREYSEFPQ